MHELALAESVLEIACRHAAGRRVTGVTVRVGYLRQVVPSALAFSFELLAQGTLAEGAALIVDPVAAIGICTRCGTESALEAFPLMCRSCGGVDLRLVAGDELIVESLDVEESETGADSAKDGDSRGCAERQRCAGPGEPGAIR